MAGSETGSIYFGATPGGINCNCNWKQRFQEKHIKRRSGLRWAAAGEGKVIRMCKFIFGLHGYLGPQLCEMKWNQSPARTNKTPGLEVD
jgi:hypothetical protein